VTKKQVLKSLDLKKGDIIVKMDGQKIATYADLSGYITKRHQ
jgi:membrane-associated protease RseP (regulator of RpoE activity)